MSFAHAAWKTSPINGAFRSYERRLSSIEEGFYWDSTCVRTADIVGCSEIKVLEGDLNEIVSIERISNTWISLKSRFPLLAARIEHREDDSLHFVVKEDRLRTCLPDEISFSVASSWTDAVHFVDKMLQTHDGEHLLSNDVLARVFVLLPQGPSDHFYFIFMVAHAITDGITNRTILRTFLEELVRSLPFDASPLPLQAQLALSVASEDLDPCRNLSIAKRRWKRAVGKIIGARIMDALKGGQTLPRKISEATAYAPTKIRTFTATLSPSLLSQIIQTSRANGVTFGAAYFVIGQIAMARVLLRHYLQGKISEEEWQWRRREPMIAGGPLNMRPYLDKEWQEAGGLSHVGIHLAFYFVWTSFLPLGEATALRPGAEVPPIDKMLSKSRFFLRARSARQQSIWFARHPLLMDVAQNSGRNLKLMKDRAIKWQEVHRAGLIPSDRPHSPQEQADGKIVFTSLGSSMGNMDPLLPREYCSPSTSEQDSGRIKLQLVEDLFRARSRPAELYLGAQTKNGELRLHANCDANVYDEDMVAEWLDEVKDAIVYYLTYEDDVRPE